jgi:hypothetical protein
MEGAMRARGLKPGFFKNETLGGLPPLARILYEGLWCLADREGRLEDRPARVKAEVLPYDDVEIKELLELLAAKDFIIRYERDGGAYIWIPTFRLHQNPHHREPPSKIPPFAGKPRASLGQAQGKPQASPGKAPALPQPSPNLAVLTPDSGLLTPDSILSEGAPPSGDAPVDNFRDIETAEDPPEDHRTHGQRLVAYYVEEHKQVCGSEPTERQIGLLADLVGKKLRRGSSPVNVRAAIRCMVAKGKGPSTLPAFVDEVEANARGQPGPGPDMGPRLPPDEQARVNREGLEKLGDVIQTLKAGGKP